jgi:Glycine cleavage system T protein (aminomethyltransferase)
VTERGDVPIHLTPLVEAHRELGARLIEFSGWLMPVQYGSIIEEHRTVRERVGLFDLSHMGELYVEGPEAGAALASALVSDPPSLAVGRAHYSMICAPDGGIIDDLIVYRLAEARFLVVANAGNAAIVSDALAERLKGFKAVLDDGSLATGLLAVQGPRAVEALGPLTDVDLTALRYYAAVEGSVAGIPGLIARTGYTGEDGFEVFVDTTATDRLWEVLLEAVRAMTGDRSGWAHATRCGSKRGCRSTAMSSTARRIPTKPALAGSSSSASRVHSSAAPLSRRSLATDPPGSWSASSWRAGGSPGTGIPSGRGSAARAS